MEILKFKSNIKCTGCMKKVAAHLSEAEGVINWDVALENPNRILTVEGEDTLTAYEINEAVRKAGYKVEQINN